MAQRYTDLFPPFSATAEQRQFIMQIADKNMSYPGQVMRQAIEALRESPHTSSMQLDSYESMLPTMRVTAEQKEFVDALAEEKDVSRAQILRSAVFALERLSEKGD